ncbi:MAG: ergothioneine biosynthesis protein EgtB [Oscillatoria sp. SIO1A7]|nr:ergothioneine biosynthesis protein EgtB [Oscillatoria sp. SIO1A7]
MKNASAQSCKQHLLRGFQECRASTLALFENLDEATFRKQVHPEFSPVGWHLGHIAMTEGLWILEKLAGVSTSTLYPEYRKLFNADGLPKCDRGPNLPPIPELYDIVHSIRDRVLAYLEIAPIEKQERLWRFILQHECLHYETTAFILQLRKQAGQKYRFPFPSEQPTSDPLKAEMIEIPAGEFEMGNNSVAAMDNERPAHRVYLDTYWIDRYPVTCGQYRQFMADGGYQNESWWSEAGWKWLQEHPVSQPLYWDDSTQWNNYPVSGVSLYEADAYARYLGKQLPTEAQWEKAASWDAKIGRRRTYPWGEEMPSSDRCNCHGIVGQTTPVNAYPTGQSAYGLYDTLGNIWEWTSSLFEPYDGFIWYPYPGYSQAYFDNQHRVQKGGSWIAHPWLMRVSFRSWYPPETRHIFVSFRCVSSSPL